MKKEAFLRVSRLDIQGGVEKNKEKKNREILESLRVERGEGC